MDPEMIAHVGEVMDASTAELCRHIDEVGESLRADLRGVAVLMARYEESRDRLWDQLARRTDGLEGRVLRLEVRVSSLEDDRKPRRRR